MAGNSTTRICDTCGQLWSSARFLDPTIETDCGVCGGRVVRLSEAPPVTASISAETERTDPAGAPR